VLEVVDQSADMRTLVHPSQSFAPGHGELSAGAVVKVSSVTGPLRAGHLASGATGPGPARQTTTEIRTPGSRPSTRRDRDGRIVPHQEEEGMVDDDWCVYARIAVGPTEIPVAAACRGALRSHLQVGVCSTGLNDERRVLD